MEAEWKARVEDSSERLDVSHLLWALSLEYRRINEDDGGRAVGINRKWEAIGSNKMQLDDSNCPLMVVLAKTFIQR